MEKVYYTIQDVKDFLKTLGFEWHGFCFINEKGVTLEAEEKIENFMTQDNIDLFFGRNNKYFAELNVMDEDDDLDITGEYFPFINNMNFVLYTKQELDSSDIPCGQGNNYNLVYFDHIRGCVAKIKRKYFEIVYNYHEIEHNYSDYKYNRSDTSNFTYYDLSEEWVNYLAKKYPQTYFPGGKEYEIYDSWRGHRGLNNITELCEKAIKYRDIDLSKPNAFIKDFENHPEDYALALKKYTTPKSFRKSLVRKRTPELKVEMKKEIKNETNDMTM